MSASDVQQMTAEPTFEEYLRTLESYLTTRSEEALYDASRLSERFIRAGLGPEDITLLHCEAVQHLLEAEGTGTQLDRLRGLGDAHQFLLELMITFGVKYREYAEVMVEERMREVEQTAQTDQERAELLAMIVHEFATPLTVARGNVDRASRVLLRGELANVAPHLAYAREALDRLRKLNDDLRESSRADHLIEQAMVEHDLAAIVTATCNWAGVLAEEKGVALLRDHASSPLPVQCNSDSMFSVLSNLISNAITYTPAGGKVTVTHGARDGWAHVEVSDTGIGISPEDQERLFEKFFRSAAARRLTPGGLGLGLPLAKQLMEAQGGRVELVRSAPDAGSTFRISLPLLGDGPGSNHAQEAQS
jgi:signal transduction histidine kinase